MDLIKHDANCQKLIISQIEKIKGDMSLRQLAKQRGCDPSVLSRILNGKYMPGEKYLLRYFPELNMPHPRKDKVIIRGVLVKCRELDDLKRTLNSLGYDINYVITKCEKGK